MPSLDPPRVGRETSRWSRAALLALMAVLPWLVTGCRQDADRTVIAVLVPADAPSRQAGTLAPEDGGVAFRDRVAERCPACVVADDYAGATAEDVRVAVDDGADVIVVQADPSALGREVVSAAGRIPVVAVDTVLDGSDWYVGYDRSVTGVAVADAVSGRIGHRGQVLLLGGSAVDSESDVLVAGLRDGLAGHGVEVVAELDATTGTGDEARDWVEDRLAEPGGRRLSAVLAVSDEQAEGVVEAFAAARLARPWPLVAGMGADLEAIRRVVVGDQTFTVHMPVARTAQRAADVALSLASAHQGEDLEDSTDVDGVPGYVFEPVVVSLATVTDTVVRDGTFTTDEICAGDLEATCADLGIR